MRVGYLFSVLFLAGLCGCSSTTSSVREETTTTITTHPLTITPPVIRDSFPAIEEPSGTITGALIENGDTTATITYTPNPAKSKTGTFKSYRKVPSVDTSYTDTNKVSKKESKEVKEPGKIEKFFRDYGIFAFGITVVLVVLFILKVKGRLKIPGLP